MTAKTIQDCADEWKRTTLEAIPKESLPSSV
jgi:hypothetical protein